MNCRLKFWYIEEMKNLEIKVNSNRKCPPEKFNFIQKGFLPIRVLLLKEGGGGRFNY